MTAALEGKLQNPDLLKSVGTLSRVKHDDTAPGAQRLEFELEISADRIVMFDLATLLDTLRFAQEKDLVAPLSMTWWVAARDFTTWPKPGVAPSSLLSLDEMDALYAEGHAKIAQQPLPVFEMIESNTGKKYVMALSTLLQSVFIAQQMECIPSMGNEWTARVMPPALRESAQTQRQHFH
jgi:hypothetical protein